jgi:putative heme-binding domain-containing protein
LFSTASTSVRAIEPWADRSLPVTDGLILWLDASRQEGARHAIGTQPLFPGGPVDIWYDGSGLGQRVIQRIRPARPTFLPTRGKAVVRFDGQDDCLELAGGDRRIEAFTAFIVAAPRANPGRFPGLLAANAAGQSDYVSGFNIDLGPLPTNQLDTVNVEGNGFGGAVDLMNQSYPFGNFHTIEVRARTAPASVEVTVDGIAQGWRTRRPASVRIDEITVGARFFTNETEAPTTRSFFNGDIAEILLFSRALSDGEAQAVRQYLRSKHEGIERVLDRTLAAHGKPLRSVERPPAVQMLVPGFAADRLPLRLRNINNVIYRPDGKVVALAYGGDIYLLSDRDGDGLEDHAELFWENRGRLRAPIGMALTPPGYKRGQGAFVAAKGKCSLIVDTNGDDRADQEIIVASGWEEIPHGVDALGVAVASDGSVFFGIGARDFTNAYLVDSAGRSHYDLRSERGTIERVTPDFRSREIIATGIRFPVGMAFNRNGDLFATDQEGATWLPNGNPFDELLHIQRGRHYGFPPRHSRYLPGVIDEPSVFDYAPQHQSTCGLMFNDPLKGGRVFGPFTWEGEAIVCGYSRGKIYRTTLFKTTEGYLAKSALIACLQTLTVDSALAPDGSLLVATHSGGPDWGSGPDGEGTLFKIRYADPSAPQPTVAWAESPREVHVAFDRPLDPARLRELSSGIDITYGKYVAAGDRFETLRPGYAAVAAQLAAPRYNLKVRGASITPDRRTLVLAVDPQAEAASYAITFPSANRTQSSGKQGITQDPAIEVAYDLTGVQATWQSLDSAERWAGWLPHPDPAVSRGFTVGSAEHERLWSLMAKAGTYTVATSVNLHNMLRPATQPGSRVNDVLPPELVTLAFETNGPLRLRYPDGNGGMHDATGDRRVEFTWRPQLGELVPIQLGLTTGSGVPRVHVSWHTTEDPRPRALPPTRTFLPWSVLDSEPTSESETLPAPELAGGDWLRGKKLFFSEKARCSQCHTVRGSGGKIGPDLSNLIQRDVASVTRDIREPSYAINPDFITYNVALADGRTLNGTIRTEGDKLLVGDTQGRVTTVARADVDEMKPDPISAMPKGLAENLGDAGMQDLLTFLLTPGFEPATIHIQGAPPERTAAEVDAVLKANTTDAKSDRPLRIVLVAGPKDHGVDEHDYPLWKERWSKLLAMADNVTVTTADRWPSKDDFAKADVLVWYSANPGWSLEKAKELDAFLARGGGMVYLHYAVNGRATPEAFAERIGLAWRDGRSKFRHGPLDMSFPNAKHPITRGFDKVHFVDETYWELLGDPSKIDLLGTAPEEGKPQPLLWTYQKGKGKVFCSIPGHYTWTFDDPLFRILILRGIAWTAGEPVDRFKELATIGARVRTGP